MMIATNYLLLKIQEVCHTDVTPCFLLQDKNATNKWGHYFENFKRKRC